ncbi:TetR/AcrR family transcriptional regulator [Nocardia sp. NPDC020380]|uniref:TetR/AcrR family transcriptional regulator n=1 Tax=Nocardia sp. NPDC020380 TaxID=3364309 RepID=UPI0037B3B755
MEQPKVRADAARNRQAILQATRALLAQEGADAVTMDRIAAAAGVAKGTLFSRFGSRAGLLHELIAEGAFNLMEAVRSGPPPLGPGVPPGDRLLAYFDAFTRLIADDIELTVAYQAIPPHPRSAELHAFWAGHITSLLHEARPDLDAEAVGALLLAPLGSELVPRMVRAGEQDRLLAAVRELVESVLRQPIR